MSLDDPEHADDWEDEFRSVEFDYDQGLRARFRRWLCGLRRWWFNDSGIVIAFWLGWVVGVVCGILLMRVGR